MKVLVTGGAGYIGSVVVECIAKQGADVTVIDNLSTGHRGSVPEGCRFVRGDIRRREHLAAALEQGVDAVFHFAASSVVAESMADPLKYFNNNLTGTITLLEFMKERGVKKLIFSSSAAVYGVPSGLPILETDPCKPENPYGQTKIMIEDMLRWCNEAWGLKHVSLRYFNAGGSTETLGEDHRPESHLIPLVLDVALGRRNKLTVFGDDYDTPDGTCIRDYVHVKDIAEAHLLALDALEKGFSGVLNLGSEKPHSVLEVIRTVEKITGKKVPFEIGKRRPGDPPGLLASSSKAEKVLGWRKKHSSLEEIISSAYRWRMSNPEGYGE